MHVSNFMRVFTFILTLQLGWTLMPAAALADDYKVIKLEQDVRNLERQVSDLYRQLNALRQGQSMPSPELSGATRTPQPESTSWLDAGKWARVHAGMSELEVIEILGKPTSMRGDPSAASRTLLYATEIGSSGFLGGSVELQNRKVTEVNKPVLK